MIQESTYAHLLVDERVEEKLRGCWETQNINTSEEETVQTRGNERKTGSSNHTSLPTIRHNWEDREPNIIIHGINEGTLTDTDYLLKLFGILGLDYTDLRTAHRLGRKHEEKSRPLKIAVEKYKFMSRLGRLKNADDTFKKISVTDDLSKEEREEIKRWVILAKERNSKNQNTEYAWKVRGTPKTGMRLAWIKQQY